MHRLLAIPMGKKVGLVVVNKAVMSQDKKVFAIVNSGVYFRTTQRGMENDLVSLVPFPSQYPTFSIFL